jgi:hypothetical protein
MVCARRDPESLSPEPKEGDYGRRAAGAQRL